MTVIKQLNESISCLAANPAQDTLHICANRETDTNLLAQTAQKGEWNKLQTIDGFFACVYETAEKVYLFCDRLGIIPLFYCIDNGKIHASLKISNILKEINRRPRHNTEGIVSMLMFGHHLGNETVFNGIYRCRGGETIVIDKNGWTEEKIIWRKKHTYQNQSTAGPDELAESFVKGVEKNIPADGKIIISFSGGFDSRAVLGAALECAAAERIDTITFGGKDCFDSQIAHYVSKKAGVKNTIFGITDKTFGDNFLGSRAENYSYGYSAFATQPQEMLSFLSEQASGNNVSLWGVGGDAIAGTHLHKDDISLERCISTEDAARLLADKRCFVPLKTVSEITSLDEKEIIRITAKLINSSAIEAYEENWQFLDAWDIFVRGRMEMVSVLPFNRRFWMCPHLNRDYFEKMSTQPFEEKLGQNIYRRILASRFKFLFSLPTRRQKGKSLTGSQLKNLQWIMRWRAKKIIQSVKESAGQKVDGTGRNYARNRHFLASREGQDRLGRSIVCLAKKGMIGKRAAEVLKKSSDNTQASLMLITLGYAFEEQS